MSDICTLIFKNFIHVTFSKWNFTAMKFRVTLPAIVVVVILCLCMWIEMLQTGWIHDEVAHRPTSFVELFECNVFAYNLSLLIVLNALLPNRLFGSWDRWQSVSMSENSKYFEIEERFGIVIEIRTTYYLNKSSCVSIVKCWVSIMALPFSSVIELVVYL